MRATSILQPHSAKALRDFAQQAGGVLCDHLQKRAVCRGFVIELDARFDGDLRLVRRPERLRERRSFSSGTRCATTSRMLWMKAIDFRWVECQRLKGVGKLKGVDNDAGSVRESIRLDDVHAPGGEHPGHISKEQRPIRCR